MKTRKEIMTEAHKIARTLEGDYIARLSEGLKQAWSNSGESGIELTRWTGKYGHKLVDIKINGEFCGTLTLSCNDFGVWEKQDVWEDYRDENTFLTKKQKEEIFNKVSNLLF